MMRRTILVGIVITGVLVGREQEVRSDTGFKSIGFELSGSIGGISPDEFNEVFIRLGFEPIDRVYGLSGGVFFDPVTALRVFGAVGYMRGSTDNQQISISDAEGKLIANTDWRYYASSIPVAIGAGFRLAGNRVALVLSLAGEYHFVSVTTETEASGEFEGYEKSSSTTSPGVSGAIGVEWEPTNILWLGLRGNYRYVSADLSFPDAPSFGELSLELSGIYGAVYVTIQPWLRGSQPKR
jgi:hypothetical protein